MQLKASSASPVAHRRRGSSAIGWTLRGLFLFILLGAEPVWAEPPACLEADTAERITEALEKMREFFLMGTSLARTELALERARSCPNADLSFELSLADALVQLSQGELSAARDALARAAANAEDDSARGLVRRLQLHLERAYLQVTFVARDGSAGPVAVQLSAFRDDTLAGEAELALALGEDLEELARGFHRKMIEAARQVCKQGNVEPLRIWLPRGTYKLSTGQTLLVEGDSGLTFPIEKVRWADRTLLLNLGGLLLRPTDASALESARLGVGGLSVQTFWNLEDRLLLTGQAGVFPYTLWDQSCWDNIHRSGTYVTLEDCLAANSSYGDTAAIDAKRLSPLVQVGLGASRPVFLGPNLPLLLGLTARGLYMWDGLRYPPAADSLNDEAAPKAVVPASLGLGLHPGAELLWRLKKSGRVQGALNLGTSVGLSLLLPVGILVRKDVDLPLVDLRRLVLVGELHLGGSLLF